MEKNVTIQNVDEYIASQKDEIKVKLEKLRSTIKKAAPDALETISYRMPAYKFHGMLIYFAAHKNHIGIYPVTSGINAFKSEVEAYQTSKGTLQFPHEKPIPFSLISKIVKFRVKENFEKEQFKKLKKAKVLK
jgi:uncharacterized protein YdhG (YjbR/CyaY superfamily)